jgi:DNA-binding transcriptional LysR family regulator
MALDGMGVAPLNPLAAAADIGSGRLKRLNAKPTGISKTVWLVARKNRRINPIAEHLFKHFRLEKSGPAVK